MNCPKCEKAIPDGSSFCPYCGSRAPVSCPKCKQIIPPGSRFCTFCGCDMATGKGPKTKKLLPILMMVLAAVILASGVGVYFGVHVWTDPTCDKPATCKICKMTEGQPLGHNMTGATCVDDSVCRNCGIVGMEAKGHQWGAATCTQPEICSVCNETQGSALGHTWPTGTTTAVEHCSVCNSVNGTITTLEDSDCGYKDSTKKYKHKMKNGATVQVVIKEMDAPVESCVGLNAGVWITGVTAGDPMGEWALLVRNTEGKWVEVGSFEVDEDFDVGTLTWSDPIDFDAWVLVPLDLGYTYNFGVIPSINRIQVFEYSPDV